MISDKTKGIIEALKEKTSGNEAHWNKAEGEDAYQLMLDNGIIVLDKYWNAEQNNYGILFKIYNTSEEEIEHLQVEEDDNESDFNILEELYEEITNYYNQNYDE